MAKCPICGKDFDAAFCPDCGIKLENSQESSHYVHESTPPAQDKPLSMWDFVLMELIAKIPVVNLVLFFVWGFSSGTNTNRRNWSRSRLIWAAIGLVGGALATALLVLLFSTAGIVAGDIFQIIS